MKIVYINTKNKIIARDMIVKSAIKSNMQYVEMEDEVLVENTLFRINEQIEFNREFIENNRIFIDNKKQIFDKEPIFVIGKSNLEYNILNLGRKQNKKDELKRNSKLVKTKINKNGYYKKRGK